MTTGDHTFATLSDADKQAFIRFTLKSATVLWDLDVHPAVQIAEWEKRIEDLKKDLNQTDARLRILLDTSDGEYAKVVNDELKTPAQREWEDYRAEVTEESASLKRISNALLAWVDGGHVPTKLRHTVRTISSSALAESNTGFESLRTTPGTEEFERTSRAAAIAELKHKYAKSRARLTELELKLAQYGPQITLFVDALRDLIGADALAADVAADYYNDEEENDETLA